MFGNVISIIPHCNTFETNIVLSSVDCTLNKNVFVKHIKPRTLV